MSLLDRLRNCFGEKPKRKASVDTCPELLDLQAEATQRGNGECLAEGDYPSGKNVNRVISLEELGQHKGRDSAWMSLRGVVYDITDYANRHPGGRVVLFAAGKDGTELFDKYHAWVKYEAGMEKYKIGHLET